MVDLNLDMYDFLIKPIREQDRLEGNEFVRRFLSGGQSVWQTIIDKIESVKDLWSVTDCPDEYLKYLKWIVGWTSELDSITKNLTDSQLRRLIAASVPLWKSRTTEDAIVNVLKLLVPTRCRVWNWFDLRWVLDVTIFTEEHQGRDSYILGFPGPPAQQEYWSVVRIVDPPDGIDRQLVKDVLNLMRPVGERYEVVYLKFLDLFGVADDLSQWSVITGSPSVDQGMISLTDDTLDEHVSVNVTGASAWGDYVLYARVRGTAPSTATKGFGVFFHETGTVPINAYSVDLRVLENKIYLRLWTAGTPATLVSFDLSTIGITLQADVWYGIRVQVTTEGTTNRIKVFLDGEECIDTTDSTLDQGGVALYHDDEIKMDCDEVEVMGLPVVSDTVEINY